MNQEERQLQQEDFYLLDVVGGASITALHPTRPIVAYNQGCMIIVYDLLTDQKINLIHHQHEIQALAFSPPGSGSAPSSTGAGGEFLISIDLNRNEMADSSIFSHSTMCLWQWQRGQCLQEIQIPRFQNFTSMLLQPNINPMNGGPSPRFFQIAFEKVGGTFMMLESSSSDMNGGGYRTTIWNLNRQQQIDMVGTLELELTGSSLGIALIQSKSPATYTKTISSNSMASNFIRFLTVEKTCIKIWEFSSGSAELLKKIQIKQTIKQTLVQEEKY